MYLTYEEYQDSMCGTLSESVFGRLEFKARKAVDAATFGRVAADKPVREAVKRLVFELVSLYAAGDISDGVLVSGASNDGVSENYVTLSETEMQQAADELIHLYLSGEITSEGTPLLYLGVD